MVLHTLLHIMIGTKEDKDFVFLLKKFKSSIGKLFDEVVAYDYTLAGEKIIVEKKKKIKEEKVNASSPRIVLKDENASGL